MKTSLSRQAEAATLTLTGDLNIGDMRVLHKDFQDALEGARQVTVDLSGVGSAHFLALQMLCAMHKTAKRDGLELGLRGITSALLEYMVLCGFVTEHANNKACGPELQHNCVLKVDTNE